MVLPQDEMIIFMEYCQNGTIEDLAKQGLDEHMIRKYSNEILQAIYILHSHDIVHRDIKGQPDYYPKPVIVNAFTIG